jgi:cytochrome bd ubiquinol oxidase subunit I
MSGFFALALTMFNVRIFPRPRADCLRRLVAPLSERCGSTLSTSSTGKHAVMLDPTVVDLSRLQFALTAMYHFLFVPLTIGLSFMIAIMESVYVMTGRDVWRRMTLFWGTLFGINFAMGVATGIVMEFQFGMNWSYYSHYVGDIFGAPLAIEGLMAFFLEATFIGLFFFGWNKLSKVKHLMVTWLVALGANFSALWILIANGWMQNPVGAVFNPETMRMEITDFAAVIFNPVAQSKFVHTVSAGYVCGAMFVMAISAFYLLRGRHVDMAKRSMAVAASFGLAASLSVVVLGDESGYVTGESQKMKLAVIEAMWETEPAPAGFNVFAIPDQDARTNHYALHIPYVMGIIGTRSLNTEMPGILELVERAEGRIRSGIVGYESLQRLRANRDDAQAREAFEAHWRDIGHALLLKRYRDDIGNASEEQIVKAAFDTVPRVAPLFWSFRLMVGLGFYFIAFFAVAFWLATTQRLDKYNGFLKLAFYSLPLPWLAIEAGWLIAEYGRQPWIIDGVLPTFFAASGLKLHQIVISLSGFVIIYSVLAVVEIWLMRKLILKGPDAVAGILDPPSTSVGEPALVPA